MDKYTNTECAGCGKLKFSGNLDEQGRCLPCAKAHRELTGPIKEFQSEGQLMHTQLHNGHHRPNRIGESGQHHYD